MYRKDKVLLLHKVNGRRIDEIEKPGSEKAELFLLFSKDVEKSYGREGEVLCSI